MEEEEEDDIPDRAVQNQDEPLSAFNISTQSTRKTSLCQTARKEKMRSQQRKTQPAKDPCKQEVETDSETLSDSESETSDCSDSEREMHRKIKTVTRKYHTKEGTPHDSHAIDMPAACETETHRLHIKTEPTSDYDDSRSESDTQSDSCPAANDSALDLPVYFRKHRRKGKPRRVNSDAQTDGNTVREGDVILESGGPDAWKSGSPPQAPQGGDRQHECNECGKCFAGSTELKRHLDVHYGVRNYICQECGKDFVQKGGLTQHMLTHTGERRFACQECGKTFARSNHLSQHMVMHTGKFR